MVNAPECGKLHLHLSKFSGGEPPDPPLKYVPPTLKMLLTPLGAMIGMWLPSIAPTHCGMLQRLRKKVAISISLAASGLVMCLGSKTLTTVSQKSRTQLNTYPKKVADGPIFTAGGHLPESNCYTLSHRNRQTVIGVHSAHEMPDLIADQKTQKTPGTLKSFEQTVGLCPHNMWPPPCPQP